MQAVVARELKKAFNGWAVFIAADIGEGRIDESSGKARRTRGNYRQIAEMGKARLGSASKRGELWFINRRTSF